MKITKITCLVSKKINQNFNSYGVSESIGADLEPGDKWDVCMSLLEEKLKKQVSANFPDEEKKRKKFFLL